MPDRKAALLPAGRHRRTTQSGTAGVETRVESFVDILRFQQKGGYVHA